MAQGWHVPYTDQNVKDLNYVYIDEISNPNEWVQITPTLRFQWGYSGHVLELFGFSGYESYICILFWRLLSRV